METLAIGSSPADEDCAQLGTPNYAERAQEECTRFISLIRKTFGPEPEGATLFIKANKHDFGTYYEVAVRFDPNSKPACAYAQKIESKTPATWED